MTGTSLGRRARAVAVIVAAGLLAGLAFPGSPGTTSAVVQAAIGPDLGAAGEFHELEPRRIVDTRQWATRPRMSPDGASVSIDVVGLGGLPSFVDDDGDGLDDHVLAVAVNVTVVGPSASGFLSLRGEGVEGGDSSLVNFAAFDDVPNAAIVRPGLGGRFEVTLTAPWAEGHASADVIIDVFGWFSTSAYAERGARLVPVTPFRTLDTRRSGQPLGPESTRTIPIRGRGSVPNGDIVVGAVVNLTAVNDGASSRDTYLALLPVSPDGPPATSNLNVRSGMIRPVSAIVPVGEDGSIIVYNRSGSVHVLVDVMGYLVTGADGSSRAGRVVPLSAPFRMIDTRQAAFGSQPLGPNAVEDWSMASFVESVVADGAWIGPQSAVIGNLTAAGLRQESAIAVPSSFVTVAPDGSALPDTSIVNVVAGADVANMALIAFGGRGTDWPMVSFRNAFGHVDLIVDAAAVVLGEWPVDEPVGSTSTTAAPTTTTAASTTTSTTTGAPTTSTSSVPASSP